MNPNDNDKEQIILHDVTGKINGAAAIADCVRRRHVGY
jgi:hypothetical protein